MNEKGVRAVNWVPCSSSNIDAVAYDGEKEILYIRFHKTGTYRYFAVPLQIFLDLRSAESAGKYFAEYVKSEYKWERYIEDEGSV